MSVDPTTAQDRVAAAQAALAQAQAEADAAAQASKDEAEANDSQAALDAERALGKGVGGYLGDLIRRVEALEAKVFPKSESTPSDTSTSTTPEPATDQEASVTLPSAYQGPGTDSYQS